MEIPRPEHPRPQLARPDWLNLNGVWRFALDPARTGTQRGWVGDPSGLDREILVPFCPESPLSGIGLDDFCDRVWYARTFRVPESWSGRRVRLRFGAVDYRCLVWVNGRLVGEHTGGSASFSFDITGALGGGDEQVVVAADDDVRSGEQPAGKQSALRASWGAMYRRVTGIWQTVWLEPVPDVHLGRPLVVPDVAGGRFLVTPAVHGGSGRGLAVAVEARAEGEVVGRVEAPVQPGVPLVVPLEGARRWSPDDPFLHDLRLELRAGDVVVDTVDTSAGLRSFTCDGDRFLLNGEPIFLRLVLDQGEYPDGIWTAPSDDALRTDIELAQSFGFNGARLHQKVFEERYHWWADRLGHLTWGEFPDWGIGSLHWNEGPGGRKATSRGLDNHLREWTEVVERDRNHPSIVAWTPFNETNGGGRFHGAPGVDRQRRAQHRRALLDAYRLTRALDPTRPVHDVSGFTHERTDIMSTHDYEQDPAVFAERYAGVEPGAAAVPGAPPDCPYQGQPYVVTEYGGTWWDAEAASTEGGRDPDSWGYGDRPRSEDEVLDRVARLTAALTGHPHVAGFCYTQLTDVEQERNGLATFDRRPKFDPARLREIFAAPAAIEQRP